MEKSILFVTTHFPPNDSIGTQRMAKLMKYLQRRGWQIFVLTLKEKHFPGARGQYGIYLPPGIRVFRTGKLDLFVLWDWIKRKFGLRRATESRPSATQVPFQAPVPNRGIFYQIKELITMFLQYPDQQNGWIPVLLWKAAWLIRRYRIGYVLVSSPPHSPHLPINWLHRWMRFIYIADFRDPWARSQWSKERPWMHQKVRHRLDSFFEKQTVHEADCLLFNTEHLREEFLQHYQSPSLTSRAFSLPNGFDPEMRSHLRNGSPPSRKQDAPVIIRHTGNLYKKRNPEPILRALAQFARKHPDQAEKLRLEFIGPLGSDLRHLPALVQQMGLQDRVFFFPTKPYLEVLRELARADWLLLLQPGTRLQLPAKFFDYLLAEKPIWAVVEPESVGQRMIQSLQLGYVSFPDQPESILAFFEQVVQHRFQNPPENSADLAQFAMPRLTEKFEQIVLTAAQRNGK